ncbi:MAG: hypothetical protein ACKVJG_17110 [Candidatus Latescibacterota bacterium]|jgi:hypothetical protein|tara:strand:- start:441 stop:1085 length:645 start_codon:yes stop_codon:yes gene_type:complete
MMRGIIGLLAAVLLTACSQNYSEESVDKALKEQGLRAVGGNQGGQTTQAKALVPGQNGARKSLGGLSVVVPEEWEEVKPSSSMRVAEYHMLAGGGEAVLAVFYFGQGQGGGVQANIDRWIAQFKQPNGADSRAAARQWSDEVAGMPTSMVEVTGTYSVGAMSGGSGEPLTNYRMLGAIVESTKGPFFFKLTGPDALIEQEQDNFTLYIKSIQPE